MTQELEDMGALVEAILAKPPRAHRRLVALVGGPGSGKTTLAAGLEDALAAAGEKAAVLPMDGFHLDNRVLVPRGLLPRKGAPETFDLGGFAAILARAASPGEVVHPLFDRDVDCAIAGAGVISETCETVIVEGNYLMLRTGGWAQLASLWDVSVTLDPGLSVLRERLEARWRDLGLSAAEITAKVEGNDLPNARLIAENSAPTDYRLSQKSDIGASQAD